MNLETNQNAVLQTKNGVTFVEFPILKKFPFIKHGFSTKLGGVSEGIFASMNLDNMNAPYPDHKERIVKNYELFADAIDVDPKTIVLSHQVHKTNLRIVTKDDWGKGLYRERDYEEIDGLITNEPNITLVTKYADCVPLFFVDPVKRVIALTHSGWRGTVEKIGALTVSTMCSTFSCRAEDIIAIIGPSICRDCFEIGEEVAVEFSKAFSLSIPDEAYDVSMAPDGLILFKKKKAETESQKYHCDLWLANKQLLMEAGLSDENITISNVCTCCNSDLFFSHRKVGRNRGSLAAFLALGE